MWLASQIDLSVHHGFQAEGHPLPVGLKTSELLVPPGSTWKTQKSVREPKLESWVPTSD